MVTLGDQVQAESYNQELGGGAVAASACCRRGWTAWRPRPSTPSIRCEYRHPIVAPFAGHERSGLLTTPVWKYFRAHALRPQTAAQVALAFQNGDPAIVEEPILRGRSILLTTAASPDSVDRSTSRRRPGRRSPPGPASRRWSRRCWRWRCAGQSQHRNRAGRRTAGGGVRGATLRRRPDRRGAGRDAANACRCSAAGEAAAGSITARRLSGLYAAQWRPAAREQQLFAVNVEPRESNLERFDRELLPSQFRRDLPRGPTAAALPADAAGPVLPLSCWVLVCCWSGILPGLVLRERVGMNEVTRGNRWPSLPRRLRFPVPPQRPGAGDDALAFAGPGRRR